ncbi:MAG: hypothetical protein WCD89_22275 [Anaerocolumna sp.]
MKEWNNDFYNISILYEDKIVRIKSDKALLEFLELPSNGSYLLSRHILKTYEQIFNKPLKINHHSLAIEIIAHVFADAILVNMSDISNSISHDKLKSVANTLGSIRQHTKIIDCGESSVDNNRHVWDILEPFHLIIYGIAELTNKKNENNIGI